MNVLFFGICTHFHSKKPDVHRVVIPEGRGYVVDNIKIPDHIPIIAVRKEDVSDPNAIDPFAGAELEKLDNVPPTVVAWQILKICPVKLNFGGLSDPFDCNALDPLPRLGGAALDPTLLDGGFPAGAIGLVDVPNGTLSAVTDGSARYALLATDSRLPSTLEVTPNVPGAVTRKLPLLPNAHIIISNHAEQSDCKGCDYLLHFRLTDDPKAAPGRFQTELSVMPGVELKNYPWWIKVASTLLTCSNSQYP